MEAGKLVDVLADLLADAVDASTASSHSRELFTEDSIELLRDLTGLLEVLEDVHHVLGLVKELVGVSEIPPDYGQLVLNLLARPVELLLPAIEHLDTRLDVGDSLGWFHVLLEDGPDIDPLSHLLADLIGDGLKDVLKLLNIVVDMSGDRPDELEAVEKRLHGLSDRLELALRDDFELALQGLEELDEVLGLGRLLHELLILGLVGLDGVRVGAVLVAQQLQDFLNCGHLQLLEQSVERRRAI